MTPEAIEELISQWVVEALVAQEANRNAGLIRENQSQNGDDDDNENGNHGNNNGDGNQNGGNGGARRNALMVRENRVGVSCQQLSPKLLSEVCYLHLAYEMPWKELMKLMIEELTLLCPRMVPKENDKIERSAEQKRKFDNNPRGNHVQQTPFKRQNVDQAYTVGNNEKKGYVGSAPYYYKCRLHHEGPCTVKCTNCKKVDHMARTVAINDACGRAYALGGGDRNSDSNVVTVLDVSYTVKLADGRIARSDTIIRGCTLNLLHHPFNIDLMPVELGSFDVIMGMDWLSKHHAVIVCDEKIVRIPYGNKILMVSVKKTEDKSEEKQLEDVLIIQDFRESKDEHEENLKIILELLKKEELYAKFSKCLADYYRRFIEGFSKIARPMTKLTQKSVKYEWEEKEETTFQLLNQNLFSASILALPEGSENFMVYYDASHKGLARF
ncbi:putative reverse transcriptase domain-containing protein [Tanacetum coccineum]